MKLKALISTIGLIAVASLIGCGKKSPPITDCRSVDGLQPICQFRNPEDFELLPDGKTLLISQMGNFIEKKPGDLALFNIDTAQKTVLFPNPNTTRSDESWGDAQCAGMPGAEFAPHGISLKQRRDGRWQLAVINHGQRESVEMFEVIDNEGHYALAWHGCAALPANIGANDLALLPDGGFVASKMFDPTKTEINGMGIDMYKGLLGMDTGYVFEWTPNNPLRVLAGSHTALPNGVEVSADGNTVFAASSGGKALLKLERASGKLLGSVRVSQPDNLSWDKNGNLLVAGYVGGMADQMECSKTPGGNCSGEIAIYQIDPNTLESRITLQHAGPPIGTTSIARQVGEHLYIGSFTGDRIVVAPYTNSPAPEASEAGRNN